MKRFALFMAGVAAGVAAMAISALVAYRSDLRLGSAGEVVTAIVALIGLGTVVLGWRDYVHRYAANVGISVDKAQRSAALKVEITNGNASPIYRCVVKVFFLTTGDLGHAPITLQPGVGGVLHPGPWPYEQRMDRQQIPDVAEIRFTDGNGRRWVRDSAGNLRVSVN